MTKYVVGDVQGCLDQLLPLLDSIEFDPSRDQLISVGDLVNRGPKSLQTLHYCKDLGDAFKMVLGNHDLHLLAIAHGVRQPTIKDTFDDILAAPNRDELFHWLQQQPLLLQVDQYHIVHAGIPPIWDLTKAHSLAAEVSGVLQSEQSSDYFQHMYGNLPALWCDDLEGPERWRLITNYLTRMRFCTDRGELELESKHSTQMPPPYRPWFAHSDHKSRQHKIVFGHWAALEGRNCGANLFALDTGCVWGGSLRIMSLDTEVFFHHPDSA